ncbi:MAG TPA: VCBS repeat-containing protein, partial [Ktedonobacteraceae bacterium]|nr:VCBS repeat-containing protein [Ktedonobacteraceae bacterium]
VTTNGGDNSITLLMGNGDGTFQSPQSLHVGTDPTGIAVGDFKGNGKLDIVTTNATDNSITLLMGNGDGTFQPSRTVHVGVNPTGVTVGDFKGDGKLDIVTTNGGDNSITLLMGNGDGTFQPSRVFLVGANPTGIMVGDFNGDGKLDIVTTDSSDNALSVLMGNGNGSFPVYQTVHVGANPTRIAVGHFNRNGKLGIATINSNDNSVSVLMNKSNSAILSRQFSAKGKRKEGSQPRHLSTEKNGTIENIQPQPPVVSNDTENVQSQQSPMGNNGIENVQSQQPPVGSNGDTMTIGISGPLSANVSWGSSTDSTGTATSPGMIRKVSVAFTDVNSDQNSDCQIIIDWGDGAKIKEVIPKKFLTKNFLISGQHAYQKLGSFQAKLTIRDSDGLQLTTTQAIVLSAR